MSLAKMWRSLGCQVPSVGLLAAEQLCWSAGLVRGCTQDEGVRASRDARTQDVGCKAGMRDAGCGMRGREDSGMRGCGIRLSRDARLEGRRGGGRLTAYGGGRPLLSVRPRCRWLRGRGSSGSCPGAARCASGRHPLLRSRPPSAPRQPLPARRPPALARFCKMLTDRCGFFFPLCLWQRLATKERAFSVRAVPRCRRVTHLSH